MAASQEKFNEALSSVQIPILILDNKWHRIFGKMNPTKEIKALSDELAALIKEQGKLVNENKSLKKIKNDLMSDIVANMDSASGANSSKKDKKLAENKRLINEVNDKLADNEDRLIELPRKIDKTNKKLMICTMEMCYDRLQQNTSDIEEIGQWIKEVRVELKKNIVKKQDLEIYNSELYSYMHDIFGPDVMGLFDMKYVPTIHKSKDAMLDDSTNKDVKENME